MDLNFNGWHPLPRYGLAAAIVDYEEKHQGDFPDLSVEYLPQLAIQSMKISRYGYLLEAKPTGAIDAAEIAYQDFDEVDRLKPGKAARQDSANGFFLAPHVLTSNNSAMMLAEMKGLQKALSGSLDKRYQLKRSFSPMTSKINGGNASMSDPKDELLQAAFTAVATSTKRKAAALDFENFTNIGLIPDLPLRLPDGAYPLVDYVRLLKLIQGNLGEARIGTQDPKTGKYGPRPLYFRGNFRFALSNVNFGSLQLLAALSGLVDEGEDIYPEQVYRVADQLANCPIYVVGYDSNKQERFGTHLSELTRDGILYRMLNNIFKVEFYDVPREQKFKDPKWKHFKRNLDRWLRRFDQASFQGFLSVRAQYPFEFLHPLKKYFSMQLNEAVIDSAMALGKSINYAAWKAADEKFKNDKATKRSVFDYKTRVLASLESNLRSATEPDQFLSQLSTLIGRMSNRDLSPEAAPFMRALLLQEISLKQGQNLLVAFMRLDQRPKKTEAVIEDDVD